MVGSDDQPQERGPSSYRLEDWQHDQSRPGYIYLPLNPSQIGTWKDLKVAEYRKFAANLAAAKAALRDERRAHDDARGRGPPGEHKY